MLIPLSIWALAVWGGESKHLPGWIVAFMDKLSNKTDRQTRQKHHRHTSVLLFFKYKNNLIDKKDSEYPHHHQSKECEIYIVAK